jgi:YD repeat-containing protein
VRSNGGLVDTFRNYSSYSGLLGSQAVHTGSTQVYGADAILYFGTKVQSFTDAWSQTSYGFEYDNGSGRLSRAQATTSGQRVFDRGYGFTDPAWPTGATAGNLEQVSTYAADGTRTTVDYDYSADRVMATRQGTTPLLGFSYDHGGRLASKTAGGVEVEGFSFDALGRLVSVRRAGAVAETLEYDPTGGVLFRKVGTTGTWYIGPFATVTASVPDGCTGSADCTPAVPSRR